MTVVIYDNDMSLTFIEKVSNIITDYRHDVIKAEKGQLTELTIDSKKVYICTNRIRRIYDETKPSMTRKIEVLNLANSVL